MLCLMACDSDGDVSEAGMNPAARGVFVLNEGSYGVNNAGISFYDVATGEVSLDLLGQTAGDTGQDILLYGSMLYTSFSVSGYISVIRADTKQEVRKISICGEDGQSRHPRYLDAYGGKVFVSTYDGHLLRIDTLTLSVDAEVATGANPEGIVYCKGKVYVANSDGLNYNNACINGRSVSVVDAVTFGKEEDIPVRANPYYLQADEAGNLYVSIRPMWKTEADYTYTMTAPPCLQRIDALTHDTLTVSGLNILKFYIRGNDCYYFTGDSQTGVFNLTDHTSKSFITDDTSIKTPYGLGIDPVTKKIYVSDSDYLHPGIVHVIDSTGRREASFEVGMNPCGFAFYH
jgi:DNA-binding beta-propeller fold protein YncE